MIQIKRVYEEPSAKDGFRILVDRLWPRGLSKEKANIDLWLKEIAPSDSLRKWFGHEQHKWSQFKTRYFKELGDRQALISSILDKSKKGKVSLLYGAADEEHNNALALKEFIEAGSRASLRARGGR